MPDDFINKNFNDEIVGTTHNYSYEKHICNKYKKLPYFVCSNIFFFFIV